MSHYHLVADAVQPLVREGLKRARDYAVNRISRAYRDYRNRNTNNTGMHSISHGSLRGTAVSSINGETSLVSFQQENNNDGMKSRHIGHGRLKRKRHKITSADLVRLYEGLVPKADIIINIGPSQSALNQNLITCRLLGSNDNIPLGLNFATQSENRTFYKYCAGPINRDIFDYLRNSIYSLNNLTDKNRQTGYANGGFLPPATTIPKPTGIAVVNTTSDLDTVPFLWEETVTTHFLRNEDLRPMHVCVYYVHVKHDHVLSDPFDLLQQDLYDDRMYQRQGITGLSNTTGFFEPQLGAVFSGTIGTNTAAYSFDNHQSAVSTTFTESFIPIKKSFRHFNHAYECTKQRRFTIMPGETCTFQHHVPSFYCSMARWSDSYDDSFANLGSTKQFLGGHSAGVIIGVKGDYVYDKTQQGLNKTATGIQGAFGPENESTAVPYLHHTFSMHTGMRLPFQNQKSSTLHMGTLTSTTGPTISTTVNNASWMSVALGTTDNDGEL